MYIRKKLKQSGVQYVYIYIIIPRYNSVLNIFLVLTSEDGAFEGGHGADGGGANGGPRDCY